MYRYTITFTTDSLDEGALRDVLEAQFRVYDCAVNRSKVGQVAPPKELGVLTSAKKEAMAHHQARLLSLFEGGTLVSPKTIKKAIPNTENTTLQKDLTKLCASGLLRKVGHGLYQSTAGPEPSEAEVLAMRNSRRVRIKGDEDERLLSFLAEPREGSDIRFFLRLSRQRVDQKLKLLMEKGLVTRRQIDGRRFLYCADKTKLDGEMAERRRHPSHAARQILACLPDGPCLVSDVARFCGLAFVSTSEAADQLESLGLVTVMRFAKSKIIALTTGGKASEYASASSEKAPVSNLSDAFGDNRCDVIELFAILGEATSRELTMAMRGIYPEKGEPGIGQRIQRLRGEGLIESITVEGNKHPPHRLSKLGEEVWDYIKPFRRSLSRAIVLGHIRNGMEDLRSRLGGPGGEWKPSSRALAMMRVAEAMGAVTQREIVELMEEPFENTRSADLALNGLRERGLMQRDSEGNVRNPYRWQLTGAGRTLLEAALGRPPSAASKIALDVV